jgi:predicted ATP-binding protein involved in virulence
MGKKMDKSIIKSFLVYGLFGTDDVHIPFEENTKILIGENGLGKTQILNIFYYTLTRDFFKLTEFPFDRVELNFDNKTVQITREEIVNCFDRSSFNRQEVILDLQRYVEEVEDFSLALEYIRKPSQISRKKNKDFKLTSNLSEIANEITDRLANNDILYFPTFRRVEEDLHNLGHDEEKFLFDKEDNRLIHFGMDDVQNRFNAIEKKIDFLLKEGFTKISGEILSKLVKGFGDTNKEILDKINETDIDIILARVGDQISETDKSRIREIVLKKEISSTDNSLFYFIQILIDIYDKQKKIDNSINQFKKVCNNYLIGKKVFYDESDIKIYIKSDSSSESLPLNKLSSGEKQIISIFSKIYLSEDNQRFIVLFDEPELSLSMTWQQKLLPDILNSKKCDFLLAVTHSPFIFDNELDRYAIGLREYIEPKERVTV